jgi:hypothetical protein
MKKYTDNWDQEDLFKCYRKYDVDYSKEQCEALFPLPEDGAKLL